MQNLLEINIVTKTKLLSQEISADDVIGMMEILTNNQKPWQSTWWKQKRNELIGDHCAQCGATEGPLVLQHLWHPFNFRKDYNYGDQQGYKFHSVLTWLEQNISYLSFVDTTTFCKKCAFLWDKKKVGKCLGCGKWISIRHVYSCDDCLCKGAYETDKV